MLEIGRFIEEKNFSRRIDHVVRKSLLTKGIKLSTISSTGHFPHNV